MQIHSRLKLQKRYTVAGETPFGIYKTYLSWMYNFVSNSLSSLETKLNKLVYTENLLTIIITLF